MTLLLPVLITGRDRHTRHSHQTTSSEGAPHDEVFAFEVAQWSAFRRGWQAAGGGDGAHSAFVAWYFEHFENPPELSHLDRNNND